MNWLARSPILRVLRFAVSGARRLCDDENNKVVTTYFRATFDVLDPGYVKDLLLGVVRDDGVVVYLNGQEVVRTNVQGDAMAADLAISSIPDEDEQKLHMFVVDPKRLVRGRNVLAVEVH